MIEYPLIAFLSITMGVLVWIAYGKVETHQRAKRQVTRELPKGTEVDFETYINMYQFRRR